MKCKGIKYRGVFSKGLFTTLLCLFAMSLSAQNVKPSKQTTPSIKSTLPQPQRAPVKTTVSISKKQPIKKNSVQEPMAQKYAKSGLMNVPVLKAPVRKKTSGTMIYLEHAESLSFDAFLNPDYQILSGNVRFKHEGATLFSDSAHYYTKTNSMYCYGNVHMEQGDTLFLYGAWLYYDGATKLVQVREKVRLENKNVTLFTDSLNYDRFSNLGYFFDGGLLVDGTNELSSEYGQYSTETKTAHFKNDVRLVNPKFVLTNSDLIYNTSTRIADIDVPTEIVSDSAFIYTNKGNYNTDTEKSQLFKRSYVINDRKRLTGDTVYYDSKNAIGEAFGNVVLIDTVQQITMIGGYGYSDNNRGLGLMTRQPFLMEHSSVDTLWLHADTLKTTQDSIYKVVHAYHNVRFFRNDFQGLCDSLVYSTADSIITFYKDPVLWSGVQQITGDFIELHTKSNKPDMMHIQKNAFLVEQVSDSLFNQTSGKDLKAYFDSGQVVKVEIRGNAETVYLPIDKDKSIAGLNRLEGSSLDLYRKNEKLEKIIIWPKPIGKFYPLALLVPEARYLKNFAWYWDARPLSPEDIFRAYKIKGNKDAE